MHRLPLLLFSFGLFASAAWAQLDLLTLRESASLLERIPDFVESQKRGECPQFSADYNGEPNELLFQVRSYCGPRGGQLIGNYIVNRETGAVIGWGDSKPSADPQVLALARQLIGEAKKRILSTTEAHCLALEAAKALPGWTADYVALQVKQFGKIDILEKTMNFTATRESSLAPAQSGRMLTVYLDEARVRDDESGTDIMSAGVGILTSKLLELRTPEWMSDEDAAWVALAVPQVAKEIGEGCKLYVGGVFYSHESLMGVACKNATLSKTNVLVNIQTGSVTDPDTGKPLDSTESQKVAHQLLEQIRKRRVDLKIEVQANCRLK